MQRRIGPFARESDHVVLAVVDLGGDVPDGDVLGAQVVIQEYLASDLKERERERKADDKQGKEAYQVGTYQFELKEVVAGVRVRVDPG